MKLLEWEEFVFEEHGPYVYWFKDRMPDNYRSGNLYMGKSLIGNWKGCPEVIDGDLSIDGNGLTTFAGGPRIVKGDFYISDNKLVDFKGCPEDIHGLFVISGNDFESLEGLEKLKACKKISYDKKFVNMIEDNSYNIQKWFDKLSFNERNNLVKNLPILKDHIDVGKNLDIANKFKIL
jgi:hypothetical protein